MNIQLGDRVGRWSIISQAPDKIYKNSVSKQFNCVCDCGTERIVKKRPLAAGESLSCGCLAREILGNRARTHGLGRHRLLDTWAAMKARCQNPKHHAYKDYGGRGITVCDRWQKFENFVADNDHLIQPGLTLDRRDNDGPYSPGNCRWATQKTQHNNRRSNRIVDFQGKSQTLKQWADELGFKFYHLFQRLERGWSIEDAFTLPLKASGVGVPRQTRTKT